jgi:hypothetical protein
MGIIGFHFDKISAEKKKELKGDIKIDNNIILTNVLKESINLSNNSKEDILNISFAFDVNYEPSLANISLKGHILLAEKPDKIKQISDSWNKEKKLPTDIMTHIMNVALLKSNIKILQLAQDVNLPPHINLPIIKQKMAKPAKSDYIG